ncbi:MAG: methylmalonyl Co-A mutase-associated GTPase MeaB [Syntrophorhabdaceae bacterium]
MSLANDILTGDEKSAARLITRVENGDREAYRELSHLFAHAGRAHVIGVTGPAGAGKSTLVGRLAVECARKGKKVGIIATDPTSIDGKGAFLGDRLRMKGAEDYDIFIRSMAHRSYPGGVAKATAAAAYIMEGLGKDCIIMESIGAGQSDKDLFFLCDTVITIFTPDYGDEIQLFKAGLMEIGDIIVVNKSDKPDAENALREINLAAGRLNRSNGWLVPVMLTEASKGKGISELADSLEAHWKAIAGAKVTSSRKADHAEAFMVALLKEELWQRVSVKITGHCLFKEMSHEVLTGKTDPYSAVDIILEKLGETWTSH